MMLSQKFASAFKLAAAFGLCAALLLTMPACAFRRVEYEFNFIAPSTAAETTAATTKALPSVTETEATTTGETEFKPDFSLEYDCGDLRGYAGSGGFTAYSMSENTPQTAALASQIQDFLARHGLTESDISIVYTDLSTQTRYTWKPDVRHLAASVIKVPMAMVCEQFIQEGIFPADMQVVYVPGDQFSADNMQEANLGKPVSLESLLQSAVTYSDNAATSAVFAYFKRHQRDLHFFMDERCGTHYASDVTLSAREGAQILDSLYFNSGTYPGYSKILEWMNQSTWGSYLTAGIPVAVAHKYGSNVGLAHEIGIVWASHPFSYSVFTTNVDPSVLPELGTLLYNFAEGVSQMPPAPEGQ